MATQACITKQPQGLGGFERYLTLWVVLCIVAGIILGRLAPGLARSLDGMSLSVDGAPVVSIPVAACLFFMMFSIMVKIDFAEVVQAGQSVKPLLGRRVGDGRRGPCRSSGDVASGPRVYSDPE